VTEPWSPPRIGQPPRAFVFFAGNEYTLASPGGSIQGAGPGGGGSVISLKNDLLKEKWVLPVRGGM